jgi:chromosome segregation ATPase
LLESAQQTLNYWREQYEKYQEKKQLQTKRRFLDRELVWAEVERKESIVKSLEANRTRDEETLKKIDYQTATTLGDLKERQKQLRGLKDQSRAFLSERLSLEHGIAENESTLNLLRELLKETQILETKLRDDREFKLLRSENLKALMENSQENIQKINSQVQESQSRLLGIEESKEKIASEVVDHRIQLALLEYRRENAQAQLESIEASLKEARTNVASATAKAELLGPRIAVIKNVGEIQDEMRLTDGHLAALADVSEDIERMYESYSKLYLELKEKAQTVAENREKTLEEVKTRMQSWRTVMQSLIERVNLEYQRVTSQTLATGEVRLSNVNDIESAGLEIIVGFKGSKPVALDSHTQSGGERTTPR